MRLRRRLAGLLGGLVLLVVAVFVVVVLRLDSQLRDEQLQAGLLRDLEAISREITFDDGELVPDDPSSRLGPLSAVGVRPDFDVLDIVADEDLWEQLPQPEDDEIDELVREVFFDLEPDAQAEVLAEAQITDGSESQRFETLFEDPSDDLVDEAYRLYIEDAAEEVGIELDARLEVFAPAGASIEAASLERAIERAIEQDDAESFAIDTADGSYLSRGVVLRDGPEVRGAAVAFVDVDESEAAGRRLRNRVLAVAGGLVGLASFAAWYLAGRSIRPAASALAQQERFLSAAAHELRTPITAIRATAEARTSDTTTEQRLARVAELAGGASLLTDDLLTLARMDAERLELQTTPTRLDYLVEAIVDEDPCYALGALEPVIVDGDVGLLTRAIENLLRNAVIHGGASADEPAIVAVDAAGVRVCDHGAGIAADERERVFERFRSGAASPGHGLGLPLARWIARAHGGDLEVVDASLGTTMQLSLPVRVAD